MDTSIHHRIDSKLTEKEINGKVYLYFFNGYFAGKKLVTKHDIAFKLPGARQIPKNPLKKRHERSPLTSKRIPFRKQEINEFRSSRANRNSRGIQRRKQHPDAERNEDKKLQNPRSRVKNDKQNQEPKDQRRQGSLK